MVNFSDNIKVIQEIKSKNKEIVFICIGTDKHVWDSLGPMTGSFIKLNSEATVYGFLDNPVTAINVESVSNEIYSKHKDAIIIAIDIAIVPENELEYDKVVHIKKGGLKPGLGTGKELKRVGDYSILYYVVKSDLSNKQIRNPFNGAVEIMNIIQDIIN